MNDHWRPGEIVVEFIGGKNNYVLYKPLGERIRGRWAAAKMVGMHSKKGYMGIPVIPGLCLCLSIKGKTIRIVDPLSFPEYEDTLDAANRIIAVHQKAMKPHEERIIEHLTDNNIKSHIWHMFTFHFAGKAKLHHGTMPTAEEIVSMPGGLTTKFTASSFTSVDRNASDAQLENLLQVYSTERRKPEPVI